jgi:RNA polymerase sigma-70 factor (ECF subfamily)
VDEAGWADASEVAAALRPLYNDLRRFAAIVGSIEVEPDDLVQEAVVRLLASGRWRAVDDIGAYLRRAIINVASNERRRLSRQRGAVARASDDVVLVVTYPSDLAELGRLAPMTRALLCLVELEGAPISEAAKTVGCSEVAARARLSRARRRLRADLESEAVDG